jgi:predicted dehydrogenase
VLCEKPYTANEKEAREVADATAASDRVVMEAFHYRYHPLAERMRAIAHERLGQIREVRTAMCFPLPMFGDIRYNYELAGGATMDAGCYAVHCLRLLGPGEPEVTSARAKLRGDKVDRAMVADFRYPGGAVGRIETSMWSSTLLKMSARVVGDRGEMKVFNFAAPQFFNRLTVTIDGKKTRERVRGDATYTYQLRAFADAVRTGAPTLTPASDAVNTMGLIDDIYRAAGLPVRGKS